MQSLEVLVFLQKCSVSSVVGLEPHTVQQDGRECSFSFQLGLQCSTVE